MSSGSELPESLLQHGSRYQLRACGHLLEPGREPALGAHMMTPRRTFTHHGIYVGRGRVVQYGGGLRRGSVEEVPLMQFSHGRPIWIRMENSEGQDRPEVVRRARSRLGEDSYHVFTNNCEHFCEWCVRGEPRSYQVEELSVRYGRAWQRLAAALGQRLWPANGAGLGGEAP